MLRDALSAVFINSLVFEILNSELLTPLKRGVSADIDEGTGFGGTYRKALSRSASRLPRVAPHHKVRGLYHHALGKVMKVSRQFDVPWTECVS